MNPKLLVFAALSAIAGWLIRKVAYEARIGRARRRAERLLDEARIEGGKLAERSREQAKREVRAEAFEQTKAMEAELSARRRSLDRETEALAAREAEIDTQGDLLERKAAHVERRADELIERLRVIGEGERRPEHRVHKEGHRRGIESGAGGSAQGHSAAARVDNPNRGRIGRRRGLGGSDNKLPARKVDRGVEVPEQVCAKQDLDRRAPQHAGETRKILTDRRDVLHLEAIAKTQGNPRR